MDDGEHPRHVLKITLMEEAQGAPSQRIHVEYGHWSWVVKGLPYYDFGACIHKYEYIYILYIYTCTYFFTYLFIMLYICTMLTLRTLHKPHVYAIL